MKKKSLLKKIKEAYGIWIAILVLLSVFGMGYKINITLHENFASAESIQKVNQKMDLEILLLRLEFVQKEIDDLEKKCSVNCSFDEKQELGKLKEKKTDLKGKMK